MTRRQRTKRRAQRLARTRWVRCPVRKQAERERQAKWRKLIEDIFNDMKREDDAIMQRYKRDLLVSTDYDSCYIDEPPHTVEPLLARADPQHE